MKTRKPTAKWNLLVVKDFLNGDNVGLKDVKDLKRTER